jgi:hypothetical protein
LRREKGKKSQSPSSSPAGVPKAAGSIRRVGRLIARNSDFRKEKCGFSIVACAQPQPNSVNRRMRLCRHGRRKPAWRKTRRAAPQAAAMKRFMMPSFDQKGLTYFRRTGRLAPLDVRIAALSQRIRTRNFGLSRFLAAATHISNRAEQHHSAAIEMTYSHHSPHDHPQSRSRLVVDDLSAQLAPFDMYGLADLGSVMVHGLIALAGASGKSHHALRAQSIEQRSA